MLDLETLSTANNAAIVAIGGVRFNPSEGTLDKENAFYCTVNSKSAQQAGGVIDAETVMWWMQQSDEARQAISGDDNIRIEVALKSFSEWVREKPLEGLWGNGANFDNVILESAYHRSGWTPPWSYKQNRCYRTLAALFPEIERAKNSHHALQDAKNQAEHLCKIWEKMYGNTKA